MTAPPEAGDVLAVVVSYDGADTLGATVVALTAQVGQVHVVDNGSDAATLAVLAELARDPKVTVELLGDAGGAGSPIARQPPGRPQVCSTMLRTRRTHSAVWPTRAAPSACRPS